MLCVALFAPLWCVLGDSCCCRLVWALLVCFYSVLLVRARAPAFRLGVIIAYDPIAVAWKIEFQQFEEGERLVVDDGWFHLWRSDEHVVRRADAALE